ncbi:hypothetical protein D3C76_619870 [compost metagenome]
MHRPLHQPAGAAFRCLVTHPQQRQLIALAAGLRFRLLVAQVVQPALGPGRDDFIERGNRVPGADLTGIDLVVVEVLALQRTVLVAEQAVFADGRRVELELDLDVLRHHRKGRAQLIDQHLACLAQVVNVGVVAVAGVGQLLHQPLVVVVHAEAEGGQGNAAATLLRGHLLERIEVADTDVEVTVGGQQDAVDAVLDEAFLRHLVGHFDTRGAGSGTARAELVDGRTDLRLFTAGGRLQHHPRLAGIDHQGDAILLAQAIHQQFEGALHQGQPLAAIHRAGHIDEEHQVGRRQFRDTTVAGPNADAQQARLRVPRRWRQFGSNAERRAIGGQRIVVGEIVDHFLQAHCAFRRQAAFVEDASDVSVAAGIDVDAEGGNRRFRHGVHGVLRQVLVLLAGHVAVAALLHIRHRRRSDHRRRGLRQIGVCRGLGAQLGPLFHNRAGRHFCLGLPGRHAGCGLGPGYLALVRYTAAGNRQQQADGETLGSGTQEMDGERHDDGLAGDDPFTR